MTKYFKFNARLTQKEKAFLEDKAASLCMTLSEYARFKLLDDDGDAKCKNDVLKWLNQHHKAFFRLLVRGVVFSAQSASVNNAEELNSKLILECAAKCRELGLPAEITSDN